MQPGEEIESLVDELEQMVTEAKSPLTGGGAKKIVDAQDVYEILDEIRREEQAWENYPKFAEPYKRIRVAYIDAARKRPAEFEKRLDNFIKKTRENKLIVGYGGIEKYYSQR